MEQGLLRACEELLKGDRALTSSPPEEGSCPAGERGDAVLESGQEHEVHEQPREPAEEPGEAQWACVDNCAESGDRCHRSDVDVTEYALAVFAFHAALD